jgi:hypothetical protein
VGGIVVVSTDELVPPGVRTALVRLSDSPAPAGVTDAERITVPEKPLTLRRLIVEVLDNPGFIVKLVGLAVREKEGVMNATVAV